jgi:U3 small nucleolar RNA-associated protein 10
MAEVEAIESEATNPTLDLWSTLPDELSNPSFFVSTPESTAVLNLFQEVVISGNSIQQEKLLSSPLLTKSPITLPSIFARVWTTLSYPLRVRQLALTHFSTFLSSPPFSHDFQGFIPHLIVALSDSSDSIRAAAASSVRVLYNRYLNASTKSTPVGLSDMYPEEEGSGGLKWLSTAEAKWLVSETLVERLPECEIDGNIIVRLIGGLLNGAGKKGKKEQYVP